MNNIRKTKLLNIFVLLLVISCNKLSLKQEKQQFHQLKEGYCYDNLLKNIIPNKNDIQNWGIIKKNNDSIFSQDIIFTKEILDEKTSEKILKNDTTFGFILDEGIIDENSSENKQIFGCEYFGFTYSIFYLKNNQWYYIHQNKNLKEFIEKIDNAYEASIIAVLNGAVFNKMDKKCRGYLKTNDNYTIKAIKYSDINNCYACFNILIDKKGNIHYTKINKMYE